MNVTQNSTGTIDVTGDGRVIQTGFDTSAAAWRWIDRQEGEPISRAKSRTAWIERKILGGAA